jgi:hypothetical protein
MDRETSYRGRGSSYQLGGGLKGDTKVGKYMGKGFRVEWNKEQRIKNNQVRSKC